MLVTACEATVVQMLPLKRCNETVCLESVAPLAVSLPVIEKDCLTWATEGAEMVRALGIFAGVAVVLRGFASIADVALQNNNAQITSTTAATITSLFSADISRHLER